MLKKGQQIAAAEGANVKQGLDRFICSCQTPPHCSTGLSPTTIMSEMWIGAKVPQI